ncbi:MAG: alpha/beta fold hydrolase [Chloroflexota bacterium]|nr:alpha/beta fold hydrolase [Chloroflexota bacterium]
MLDYITRGDSDNPALLLLHAGGMTRGEWDPFLDSWSKHFYLIVPSALGHGASPSVLELSISAMADAVLELLDHLGVEKAHMLGSSMGGAIALWIVLTEPERVDKLIIFRTSYRSSPAVHEGVQQMAEPEAWQQWRLDRWMSEQHEPQGGPDAWMEVTKKVADAFDPATTEHMHDLGDLATIASPTLIISGDRDPVVPLEDAIAMYRTIPDAALWVVPNATHFMGTEGWRRESFEQEIIRFLRRQ